MQSALALAAVTVMLKSVLQNRLVQQPLAVGDVTVTALPPDRIATGNDERPQVNIYLYRVSPRSTLNKLGNTVAPAGLTLDLHYLISTYGEREFQADILLGQVIQTLSSGAVLNEKQVTSALAAATGPAGVPAFGETGGQALAARLASLTITPEFLNPEDLSKLWSALQAKVRPAMTYVVSPLGIDAD